MQATCEIAETFRSKVADLRRVPLAEMPALSTVTLDEALRRVLPAPGTAPVPVAAFSSSI